MHIVADSLIKKKHRSSDKKTLLADKVLEFPLVQMTKGELEALKGLFEEAKAGAFDKGSFVRLKSQLRTLDGAFSVSLFCFLGCVAA